MKQSLVQYIENIKSPHATIASVMNQENFFTIVNEIFGKNIHSMDELHEASIHEIFYFTIPEWKKEFSIDTVKEVISALSLRPYNGKNIFVLDHFDTAGPPAQNATLKMIEECPDYAVIILIVENPRKLLPTIDSRTILLFDENLHQVDDATTSLLEKFFTGSNNDKVNWISYLYQNDFSQEKAKTILIKVFPYLNFAQQNECKKILIALESTYENPKLLLETFFLWEDFF